MSEVLDLGFDAIKFILTKGKRVSFVISVLQINCVCFFKLVSDGCLHAGILRTLYQAFNLSREALDLFRPLSSLFLLLFNSVIVASLIALSSRLEILRRLLQVGNILKQLRKLQTEFFFIQLLFDFLFISFESCFELVEHEQS